MLAQSVDTVRIATFAAPLSRDGPGLLLRDILKAEDSQIIAIAAVIDHIAPDILLLTDFDFDAGGGCTNRIHRCPRHTVFLQFCNLVERGPTGRARRGRRRIYGRCAGCIGLFLGDGGMAILSRWPIANDDVIDLSATLWRDVPSAELPVKNGATFPNQALYDALPVSSAGHWIVPISINEAHITLLAFSATAPVFDGPEDFNGLRNRDELRLCEAVLDGKIGPVPTHPILIGNANADPFDGEVLRDGIVGVLARTDLTDPMPRSVGTVGEADASHLGDPALDTADWSDEGPGNLRVSYILPSTDLRVIESGVFWPVSDNPFAAMLGDDGFAAGPHRLVWVDIAIP